MRERIRIDDAGGLPADSQKVYTAGERRIAVFNVGGELYAIDNTCPHRGAALGKGTREGLQVRCPLHGWWFDLKTGESVSHGGPSVRRYDVFRQEEEIILDLTDEAAAEAPADTATHYLVRYGSLGWVDRFAAPEELECGFRDRVVLRTSRGQEVGEVLSVAGRGAANDRQAGEVLRRLSRADEGQCLQCGPLDRLDEYQSRVEDRGLSIEIIDGERLFDGESLVLYFLGTPGPGLELLASELTAERGVRVRFHPVIEPPPPAGGGCGSGTCGCRTAQT